MEWEGYKLKRKFDAHRLVQISAVAAFYFVMTVVFSPISFGAIQFRLSEILVLLCFYKRDYCYSLILGCALANLFSPMGVYDVIFGTLATVLSVICIYKSKNLLLASLFPTLSCIIVGLELHWVLDLPLLMTSLTVMLGEFVVVTVLGYPLFKEFEKSTIFEVMIGKDRKFEKISR